MNDYAPLQRARYLSSVSILYVVTLLLFWQLVLPILPFNTKARAEKTRSNQPPVVRPVNYVEPIARYGMPGRLIIPKLGYDREILKGNYDPSSKAWNVTGQGIHYAYPSSQPNDIGGSTLIYGHNNRHVFGPLQSLREGDPVQVITDNKLRFTYRYDRVEDYEANDTSILSYAGEPILSLQTCAGYFNEIRRIYIFNFVKVEKL